MCLSDVADAMHQRYIKRVRPSSPAVQDHMSHGEIAEIGKYRILGQIGEGAMGVVYRALDPVLNRPVAIKVMSESLARDKDLRDRFLREAQSAGSLQHPNVITIYDFGEVDGHPFIAMEFVEGVDLSDILTRNTPLSLVEKIDVLIDVLNGLSYAHKRGIVHRDIKPANIRIDEEGRARIMDFGIAHLTSSNITRTGVTVGTPAYMSPEQITGGAISAASDIFGVGAVMYELLTGVQAFKGDSLQSVMYKIISAPTPELPLVARALSADQNASVSKALGAIISRALAKEPSGRFENAQEMAGALSEVRARVPEGNEPARTSSLHATVARVLADVPGSRLSRLRRRRVIWAGIAGGTVLVAAAITLLVSSRNQSTPAPPIAAPVTQPVAQNTPAVPTATAVVTLPPGKPEPTRASSPQAVDAAKSSAQRPVSANEASLFRALQSTALEARRRAVEAGASSAQLDSGDGQNKVANALVLQGKATEGGDHLNQAAALWAAAERTARAINAMAAAPRASPVEPPKQQAAAPPVAVPAPLPQTAPTQQSQSPPAANPAADIAATVAAYARALESRDVAAVRRAYPTITSAQAKGWEQFFSTLRSLRVNLAINGLEVTGATADAKLVGVYDYITDAGKAAQQPVSFQASFRREGSTWQLVSVH